MGLVPHKTEKPCSFLGSDWTTLKAARLHPPSLPCRGHWGPLRLSGTCQSGPPGSQQLPSGMPPGPRATAGPGAAAG